MANSSDTPSPAFRWQTLFQQVRDPIFLLNARRRLVFANRAWEELTQLPLADVRGRPCRRLKADARDPALAVLAALAPPPEALKGGACQARRRAPGRSAWWEISYFPLPGDNDMFTILGRIRLLDAAAPLLALPEKLVALQGKAAARYRLDDVGSDSPALQQVKEQARLAASLQCPVLLIGERGTGKEWLARAIHQAGANRAHSFACLDSGRLPGAMIGEVLFNPGAIFGTVYLRHLSALALDLQARLADRLTGDDCPRLIAGLTTSPTDEVHAGRLLEALACRIGVLTIALPPLRDRGDELARFVDIFRLRAAEALAQTPRPFSEEALQTLAAHSWPGNLGELYAVILATSRHAAGERVDVGDVPFHLRHGPLPPERKLPLDELLEQAERRLIELALNLTHNHKTRAAELLGIWPTRLVRRMKHFGLLGESAGPEEA